MKKSRLSLTTRQSLIGLGFTSPCIIGFLLFFFRISDCFFINEFFLSLTIYTYMHTYYFT